MKKLNNKNINTQDYWNNVYKIESNKNKQRVDNQRLEILKYWINHHKLSEYENFKLLDIGCCLGDVADCLKGNYKIQYTGIDISSLAINIAKEKFHKYKNIQFECYDLQEPLQELFPSYYFDFIFCGETLEHISEPIEILNSIKIISNQYAYVMITVPYENHNYSNEHIWEYDIEDMYNFSYILGRKGMKYLNTSIPDNLSMILVTEVRK